MSSDNKLSVPESLASLHTKVDMLVGRAEEDRSAAAALAARVSQLENFKYQLMGAAIVASFVFSFVSDLIKKAL